MKKRIKGICSLLAAALILCGQGFAAETKTMQLDWEGDYAAMELVVTVCSPVRYNQQIAVALYPDGTENPTVLDYVRVAEVTAHGQEPLEIRFPISDGLDADGGVYRLLVQGNGYRSEESLAEDTVYILRPADVSGTDGLLGQLCRADADTVLPYLRGVAPALKMTVSESESTLRLAAFVRVRDKDYQGFEDMNRVRDAWKASGVLEKLEKGGLSADAAAEQVESIADLLNLNLNDAEYIAYRSKVYQSLIAMTAGSKTLTLTELSEMLTHQARWLAIINGASLEDMEDQLKILYKDMGITESKYNAFLSCNAANRQKVLRQLYQRGFTSVQDVVSAFEKAVDAVTGATSETGQTTRPTGGSSGGGGRGGGVSGGTDNGYKIQKDEQTNQPDQTELPAAEAFSDCGEDHWGYPYIAAMKESGIIAGYPDGSFRPEQTVSREEFVKMAVTASGLYQQGLKCDFSDAEEGAWYDSYIASAYRAGIVTGMTENTFGIGTDITREDVAVIVYRILKESEGAETAETAGDFADFEEISEYARESVSALAEKKILNGYEDGTFRPKAYLTRAEAAKIIYGLNGQIRK